MATDQNKKTLRSFQCRDYLYEIFEQMSEEHIAFMLAKIPMKRFLAVEEAAAMIGWLSSEDCAFSTGAVFDISGGRATY